MVEKKEKIPLQVEIPNIISFYNANMSGVDSFDQMVSYYRVEIKSQKWTLRMISYRFHAAIANAYLNY